MTTAIIENTGTPVSTELQVRIKNLLERDKVSQKSIAQQIDYSPSALSLYLNNEYTGDIKAIEEALKKFLDFNQKAKVYKKVILDFAKTSVASKLFNIAQICHLNGEIGLCTGLSGLGKTTAIKEYAKNHTGVIIIDPDENLSVKGLFHYFCKPLHLDQGINESNVSFCEKIVKKLKNSGKLIIVDESENLDVSCIRVLRKIHDRCNGTIGLLFVGTERLVTNLAKLRGENDYLFTRFGYIDSLDSLNISDAKALITQVFPNSNEALIKVFYEVSGCNGRVLFNLLKRTKDILESSKDDLNVKIIKAAGRYIGAANNV